MVGKRFIIQIVGPIIILALVFMIIRESGELFAQTKESAQVVHSNDYNVILDTPFQASLAEPAKKLNPIVDISTSTRSDKIRSGSKTLINNLWGAPDEETLTSAVYLKDGNTYGWHWDRPNPLAKPGIKGYQPIYPMVRTGGCPWEASRTTDFPIKVGDIKSLTFSSEYSYPSAPTGVYNLAYDMFLSDTNQASSNPNPKIEIMIWLENTLQQPADAYKGEVSDGVNTFGLYSFTMPNGRLYYAFVLKNQTFLNGQHSINAGKLMEYLKLDPRWYLYGVELGNEIITGSGAIEITENTIVLNGRNL
jgi:hypothetical protein